MAIRTLLIVVVVSLLAPALANARGPRWRRLRPAAVPQRVAPVRGDRLPRYEGDWRYPYNALYPRYIGGFHYRTITQFGYPPGDIGIRGTAW